MSTFIPHQRPSNRADLRAWYGAVLQQQEEAGLSVAEAAEAIGVSSVTLYAWKRRLSELTEEATTPTGSGLIRVRIRDLDDPVGPSSRPPLVLRLGHGRAIEVPSGFDGDDLARLIAVATEC